MSFREALTEKIARLDMQLAAVGAERRVVADLLGLYDSNPGETPAPSAASGKKRGRPAGSVNRKAKPEPVAVTDSSKAAVQSAERAFAVSAESDEAFR